VHLVGFTTEIYHDARSHERQICNNQVHAAHTLFPSSVSVFFSNLCLPSIRTPYYLHNFTEIAHAQRVPYSEQLLHIQHRLYVFGRLRGKNGRRSPTPRPASSSVFTHIFLNFISCFFGGDISKFRKIKGRKFVISEKLILTVDFSGGRGEHPDS
jgi:hypothetical protein